MSNRLTGKEEFLFQNKKTGLNMLDFWQWHYSDVYSLHDMIAEYIVARAMGCEEPYNSGSWTLYDISYRGMRIEVKETSYYHSWQSDEEPKSNQRRFGITKAYSIYKDNESEFARQNDIYVFCLNTGETREGSNPLNLENWEFYVIPTSTINKECGDSKTVGLSKVRKLTEMTDYSQLREKIDIIIDEIKKEQE